jgi:hypothetical protein
MDIKEILNIAENVSDKPNQKLVESATILAKEFEDTKTLLIQLSHHLDKVEESYYKISEEIKKRNGGQ